MGPSVRHGRARSRHSQPDHLRRAGHADRCSDRRRRSAPGRHPRGTRRGLPGRSDRLGRCTCHRDQSGAAWDHDPARRPVDLRTQSTYRDDHVRLARRTELDVDRTRRHAGGPKRALRGCCSRARPSTGPNHRAPRLPAHRRPRHRPGIAARRWGSPHGDWPRLPWARSAAADAFMGWHRADRLDACLGSAVASGAVGNDRGLHRALVWATRRRSARYDDSSLAVELDGRPSKTHRRPSTEGGRRNERRERVFFSRSAISPSSSRAVSVSWTMCPSISGRERPLG